LVIDLPGDWYRAQEVKISFLCRRLRQFKITNIRYNKNPNRIVYIKKLLEEKIRVDDLGFGSTNKKLIFS